jgi:hypothetical protein
MRATSVLLGLAVAASVTGFVAAPRQPQPLVSPAPAESAQPQLAVAPDGTVYLSWLEKVDTGSHRFRFATLAPDASAWSKPAMIHEGPGFFANWADVPSLTIGSGGLIAAHWLQVSGAGKYAYDVKVATSRDGGRTWSAPVTPHRDKTEAEHGFASFFPWPADRDGAAAVGLAWLDGRTHGQMALRAARITADGAGEEMVVDDRVCDCCPTSAVRTSRGVALAYRDRSPDEIRDIYVSRFEDGKWSEGRVAVRDNWQIAGCPVNGPSMSASGDRVALAWFAAPESKAHVSVAFSTDAAASFGAPVRVDGGNPMGRVDVELLADGSALVGWIEQLESGAQFRARRVWPDGRRGDALTIASLAASRASGYPRIARSGERLVFAWVGARGVETSVAR